MIKKKKNPKRGEISKFSVAIDDSVSRQLQKHTADARKTYCFREDHFEMLSWLNATCSCIMNFISTLSINEVLHLL